MNRSSLSLKNNCGPYHGRPHIRNQFPHPIRNEGNYQGKYQSSRFSGTMHNSRPKSTQKSTSVGPTIIDYVEYSPTDVSSYTSSGKLQWYSSL